MGGAVFSLFWTSDLRLPSTGACWQWVVLHLCAKWQPLGELTLRSRPWVLYTTVLCPHCKPQLIPACKRDCPRPAGRSVPGSCGVTAFPGSQCMWNLVHFLRADSLFTPALCRSCAQAPVAFKGKCSEGSSSPCPNIRLGSLAWGSKLPPVGLTLWCNYFSVCGSPTLVWDLILSREPLSYHLVVASLDVAYPCW